MDANVPRLLEVRPLESILLTESYHREGERRARARVFCNVGWSWTLKTPLTLLPSPSPPFFRFPRPQPAGAADVAAGRPWRLTAAVTLTFVPL